MNMAVHVNNMKELRKALQPVLLKMTDELAERVYKTLNYFLQEYYSSYHPESYRRQYDFLRSAVKTKAEIKGNKVVASVFIDTDSMDDYYSATGYEVAQWANQRLHGGTVETDSTPRVWDDTLDSTVNNGELLKLAAGYLRSKGFSVRM